MRQDAESNQRLLGMLLSNDDEMRQLACTIIKSRKKNDHWDSIRLYINSDDRELLDYATRKVLGKKRTLINLERLQNCIFYEHTYTFDRGAYTSKPSRITPRSGVSVYQIIEHQYKRVSSLKNILEDLDFIKEIHEKQQEYHRKLYKLK